MKNNHYLKPLRILVQELTHFQKLLDTHCNTKPSRSLKVCPLEQLMNSVQNIKAIAEEAKRVRSLTLLNQDFSHFCLLLVNGSDMADYVLALNETHHGQIQKQAHSWKKIAVKFKPFLENSIYNEAKAGFHNLNY
jgi:hypothetical protein